MQIIAQSPLVLQLTQNSGIALGIISLAQASPFLIFSFVGGGVADRVDKRRLLLVTQGPQIVYAFVLGILTVTGLVQFWHIVVLSMLVGVTLSFDQPTRFALIPSLVPREDLSNAISLNTILFNGAAIVGSALGGVLVMVIGYAGVFFVNGLSYVAVLVALLLMRPSPIVSSRSGSLFRAIRGGLTHTYSTTAFLQRCLSTSGRYCFSDQHIQYYLRSSQRQSSAPHLQGLASFTQRSGSAPSLARSQWRRWATSDARGDF